MLPSNFQTSSDILLRMLIYEHANSSMRLADSTCFQPFVRCETTKDTLFIWSFDRRIFWLKWKPKSLHFALKIFILKPSKCGLKRRAMVVECWRHHSKQARKVLSAMKYPRARLIRTKSHSIPRGVTIMNKPRFGQKPSKVDCLTFLRRRLAADFERNEIWRLKSPVSSVTGRLPARLSACLSVALSVRYVSYSFPSSLWTPSTEDATVVCRWFRDLVTNAQLLLRIVGGLFDRLPIFRSMSQRNWVHRTLYSSTFVGTCY